MNLKENIERIQEVMGVLVEQSLSEQSKKDISRLIKTEGDKVRQHYLRLYSNPQTIAKFSKKQNVDLVKKFIPTISFKIFSEQGSRNGYVKTNDFDVIYLNLLRLFKKSGDGYVQNGSLLYDTILHEMAHCIDFKMQSLGERTISSSSGYYDVDGGQDEYVSSDIETFARVQRMREVFGISPGANGEQIKDKLVEFIRSKRLVFPNVQIGGIQKPVGLMFTPSQAKGVLTKLWGFYDPMKVDGTKNSDISALFAKFSSVKDNKKVFLNLDSIGKINLSTKGLPSS
jgi:hypothetical protein